MLAENFGLCQTEKHEAHAQTMSENCQHCNRIESKITDINHKQK